MAVDARKVETLIGQCVDSLVADNPEYAAKGLKELAELMSKAGYGKELFADTRKRMIILASQQTARPYILEKLKIAEQDLWQKTEQQKKSAEVH